ncbi:uncharacterized protein L969DRAFT_95094 [Mixia osmundae IAM 14324]|uniref:Uncharacterized protein n=1 Tax=Mixia osmundae (strain CBS 9802 / IAM 14324 / JCM 22182 / KY 12970) TaxID=764103 RepID=G7E771_MIXOS|nr:uncharacterized protein L969DRAFT_95094 [Mixia osmundae IAM 14324]KEI38934.1 hypothetical protein L969DRAFT_95094 [Mixia osmundae IAM 14324]GAA98681.1 hypothetical protein E5Q_05369 [Mixia osmundae IAM 14324]
MKPIVSPEATVHAGRTKEEWGGTWQKLEIETSAIPFDEVKQHCCRGFASVNVWLRTDEEDDGLSEGIHASMNCRADSDECDAYFPWPVQGECDNRQSTVEFGYLYENHKQQHTALASRSANVAPLQNTVQTGVALKEERPIDDEQWSFHIVAYGIATCDTIRANTPLVYARVNVTNAVPHFPFISPPGSHITVSDTRYLDEVWVELQISADLNTVDPRWHPCCWGFLWMKLWVRIDEPGAWEAEENMTVNLGCSHHGPGCDKMPAYPSILDKECTMLKPSIELFFDPREPRDHSQARDSMDDTAFAHQGLATGLTAAIPSAMLTNLLYGFSLCALVAGSAIERPLPEWTFDIFIMAMASCGNIVQVDTPVIYIQILMGPEGPRILAKDYVTSIKGKDVRYESDGVWLKFAVASEVNTMHEEYHDCCTTYVDTAFWLRADTAQGYHTEEVTMDIDCTEINTVPCNRALPVKPKGKCDIIRSATQIYYAPAHEREGSS